MSVVSTFFLKNLKISQTIGEYRMRMLSAILWLTLGTEAIFIILSLLLAGEQRWTSAAFFFIFVPPTVLSLWFMRRGRLTHATLIFTLSLWLGTVLPSFAEAFYSESRNPLPSYLIIVLIAGLLMGGRAALTLAGLSVLAEAVLIGWHQGTLPTQLQWGGLVAELTLLLLVSVLLTITDRTIRLVLMQLQEKEMSLALAHDKALEANRAKSRFLATISHEIRTPLSAVIGMADVLSMTELTEQQENMVGSIQKGGDNLLSLINDILDFSKIEAGKLTLEYSPVDLWTCVEAAIDLFAVRSAEKGLSLTYSIAPDVPVLVEGDGVRLHQIIVNLLSNAVKFTQEGSVTLMVEAVHTNGRCQLHFAITDSGIGIAEDNQDLLFEPFSQVDVSITRQFGGSGLGLAICKNLVSLMDGSIGVESELGKGSTFHFTIPVTVLPAPTLPFLEPVQPLLVGKRILLTAGMDLHLRYVSQYAAAWEMQLLTLDSATDILNYVERGGSADAILMPLNDEEQVDDTLALLEAIWEEAAPHYLPTVLAVPVGFDSAEIEREYELPTITLPLKPRLLYSTLLSLFENEHENVIGIEKRPSTSQSEVVGSKVETPSLNILLVEDDSTNIAFTSQLLSGLGHKSDIAHNGQEAVEAVRNRWYDVILMDIHMPVMDGLEATRRIRRILNGRQSHIIALTADVVENTKRHCLAVGMNDYVPKPINIAKLESALGNFVLSQGGVSL